MLVVFAYPSGSLRHFRVSQIRARLVSRWPQLSLGPSFREGGGDRETEPEQKRNQRDDQNEGKDDTRPIRRNPE